MPLHFMKDWYLYCETAVGEKSEEFDPKCRLSAEPGLSRQEAIDSAKAAGWLVSGCRIAQELKRANDATDDLQKQITGRLAEALPGIGCEIEGAIHRASKEAIKEVAQQIGTIKSVEEGKDGSMTVVVEA